MATKRRLTALDNRTGPPTREKDMSKEPKKIIEYYVDQPVLSGGKLFWPLKKRVKIGVNPWAFQTLDYFRFRWVAKMAAKELNQKKHSL